MIVGELGDAGVVEQGVDPSERRRGGGDAPAILVLGDIAPGQDALGALGFHKPNRLGRLRFAGGVVDDHRACAAFGDLHGDGAAEAGGGAGDQHHPAVEILARHDRASVFHALRT